MDNKIRLSGIAYDSLVNGPGMRRVLFSQGCKHNCKGCFNPETHDFNGGRLIDLDEIITQIIEDPFLTGLTFSGGDPLEQAEKFAYIGNKVKKAKGESFNIWCYTGYTFEYILENKDKRKGWNDLLQAIDVFVDGEFKIDKMKDNLKYRGSSNQRIIDVKGSLKNSQLKILNIV